MNPRSTRKVDQADSSREVSDEQLMAGALRGSMPAFEELYYRYAHRIVRFARRLMRDHQDAESITQEVFLRLLKHSAAYDPSRRFSTWIYTIARNLCLDALARRRADVVADGDQFPGREPDPAAHVEERETGQQLRAAVDALPHFCREVVQLRVFERFSYGEIADVLGCPESTARSRMDLAIKRLRADFGKNLERAENCVDESPSRP